MLHHCFESSAAGKVTLRTKHFPSMWNKTAARHWGSQLCCYSGSCCVAKGKNLNYPQENPQVVAQLEDLKNQILRPTKIKFNSKRPKELLLQ